MTNKRKKVLIKIQCISFIIGLIMIMVGLGLLFSNFLWNVKVLGGLLFVLGAFIGNFGAWIGDKIK